MAQATGKVYVTGAGGYLGSWVVKHLLSKNYVVHGTVRQPGDAKYAQLNQLEKASDNLKLVKADLLDYDSLCSAIAGCAGVFHVASPVFFHTVVHNHPKTFGLQVELIEPAVKGTLNVLKACLEANVKRVVFVSSIAAILLNPRWPEGQIMDETCWSDKEYCASTKNWYFLSKTEAESEAFEFAKSSGLDVVSVCPTLILGPLLQPTINTSSLVLIKTLKEGYDSQENNDRSIVDVRDVARALLLAYEKPQAEGRYLCTAHMIKARDLADKLRSMFPQYNYPKRISYSVTENIVGMSTWRLCYDDGSNYHWEAISPNLPSKLDDDPKGPPIVKYPSMANLLSEGCSKLIENDDRGVDKYPMFRTEIGNSVVLKESSIAKAISILNEDDVGSTDTPSKRFYLLFKFI
ncbi:NAD(P)-binding Rossmann-fold superfamily protein isoform 2 [Hibiscus syriacus]|uniref:NAD(P)-binding Rossmann-fold superfamily protein isoform 2 n=1 Tax=Hibiscus syriacus TaxID=106335 RepID=A0A6A2X1E2_HIBSY|nr:NAD(P)-binding Rossmann-fold superfamily protein isoform 2 [Hibiscus syriacus]